MESPEGGDVMSFGTVMQWRYNDEVKRAREAEARAEKAEAERDEACVLLERYDKVTEELKAELSASVNREENLQLEVERLQGLVVRVFAGAISADGLKEKDFEEVIEFTGKAKKEGG